LNTIDNTIAVLFHTAERTHL